MSEVHRLESFEGDFVRVSFNVNFRGSYFLTEAESKESFVQESEAIWFVGCSQELRIGSDFFSVVKEAEGDSEFGVASEFLFGEFLIIHDEHFIELIEFVMIEGDFDEFREIDFGQVNVVGGDSDEGLVLFVFAFEDNLILREAGFNSFRSRLYSEAGDFWMN